MTLLPNPDFLAWLLKAIQTAHASIILVNYLATLRSELARVTIPSPLAGEGEGEGDPVAAIVIALASSMKRGVIVTVILEGSKFRENYPFYRGLKDAGADVWMDTSLTFIHTKAVLMDDKVLCIGSHNLSQNALTRHEEASITTNDARAIARFKNELEKMTAQRRTISADVCRAGTQIPLGVISVPLTKIKRSSSSHAYLLYLLLCKLDGGKKREIKVDAESWVRELALPKSTASAGTRIETMLEMMDKKLRIIKFDKNKGKITRSYFPSPSRGEGRGEGDNILIPSSFWKFHWHTRLTVDAIHLYLAGEAEKISSPFAPWWRLKRDEIAAKYGFQKQLVGCAQKELQKFDLLEVLTETAGDPKAGRYVRYMNYFRQNPFYDYDARMAKIGAIAKRFPVKIFSSAQKLASLTSSDSDAEKIETLCKLVSKTSIKAAERVARVFNRLAPNSTKRTFAYVEEMFRSW